MITNGLHESLGDPSWVPMITGSSKQQNQESLTETLTGDALAFAKVIAHHQVFPVQHPVLLAHHQQPWAYHPVN